MLKLWKLLQGSGLVGDEKGKCHWMMVWLLVILVGLLSVVVIAYCREVMLEYATEIESSGFVPNPFPFITANG